MKIKSNVKAGALAPNHNVTPRAAKVGIRCYLDGRKAPPLLHDVADGPR